MAGIPKLIILSEQFRGRTFELTKDQHTVGRVDERDICIKDPTVSTYHCRFVKSGNTYILEISFIGASERQKLKLKCFGSNEP